MGIYVAHALVEKGNQEAKPAAARSPVLVYTFTMSEGKWFKRVMVGAFGAVTAAAAGEVLKPKDSMFADVSVSRPDIKEPGQQEAVAVKLEENK